jgi:L-fuconolactonase
VRLDAHIHLFANGFDDAVASPLTEPALYEQLRAEHGIDAALVVGYESGPRYSGNNRYLERLAADRPWLHPLAYRSVDQAPTPAELSDLQGAGFRGISVYVPDRDSAKRFACWSEPAWRAIDEYRMIVSVNAALGWIGELDTVLRPRSGSRVLFSHLGLPGPVDPSVSAAALAELYQPLLHTARYPHVGVKASGFYALGSSAAIARVSELIVHLLLDAFGPERLYWGSDFSPCLRHGSFFDAVHVPALDALTPTETENIHGANLARLLDDT